MVPKPISQFYYDCAIIHLGINDILQSKDMSEIKNLPKKTIQIQATCYNNVTTLVRQIQRKQY